MSDEFDLEVLESAQNVAEHDLTKISEVILTQIMAVNNTSCTVMIIIIPVILWTNLILENLNQ